ncbi:hypothetical protein POL68_39805 [Stigmatella sp. ncwal1]|uniref:Uncharacterized protein n=1 Tax=Stigmatella ashevillensis TaxID=2995309 RepID=A0ABT5DQK1_9BACT|nr:hypothetical protein [Stigmatella ashevillena]MDC0714662.1 hypothetical protein [Stigmatella ashevillena]
MKSRLSLSLILPLVVALSVQVACGGVEEDVALNEEDTVHSSALSCPSGTSLGCDLNPNDSSTEWMTLKEYGGCCGIGNIWKWYNTKTCRRYCGFNSAGRAIQWWSETGTGGYCSLETGCY